MYYIHKVLDNWNIPRVMMVDRSHWNVIWGLTIFDIANGTVVVFPFFRFDVTEYKESENDEECSKETNSIGTSVGEATNVGGSGSKKKEPLSAHEASENDNCNDDKDKETGVAVGE